MKTEGEAFAKDSELILSWDRCDHMSNNIKEGGIVGEGEIVDNLMDVVEWPTASLCNRGDFQGTMEWGVTLAGESILVLDSRQEGPAKT